MRFFPRLTTLTQARSQPNPRGPSRHTLWRRRMVRRALSIVCVTVAAMLTLGMVRPPAPPTVTVVTAARDIGAGHVLVAEDLRTTTAPASALTEAMGRPPPRTSLVGRRAATPLRAGEPITPSRLVARSMSEGLPPDTAATHLPVSDDAALGLISAGQRVTIFAESGGAALAHDVLVLAVDPPAQSSSVDLPGKEEQARGLVVALTRTAVERIYAAPKPDGVATRVVPIVMDTPR